MTYEVHHFTLCDGWINCWSFIDQDGVASAAQYDTRAEAEAAIEEFLADIAAEVAAGERALDECYDRDEFAVVEVEAE